MSLNKKLADMRREKPAPVAEEPTRRLDELSQRIHNKLIDELGPRLYDQKINHETLRTQVRDQLKALVESEGATLSPEEKRTLVEVITSDALGYGPIEPSLRDNDVSEVMVNNAHTIYVERKGKLYLTEQRFFDENHLRRIIDKIVSHVGRHIDESSPMVDARLPDGSRVNAVVPPLAVNRAKLTIRKFSAQPLTVDDLVKFDTLTADAAEFLHACVRGRLNVLVSGGTGSGKTTTLNVLSSFIPSDERIVTIEDAVELQLNKEHWLQLESRPANVEGTGQITIRDLVRNALRMRPDRIVVGEVRGGEALDMLQAMNTGHDGSITTVHANSPRDVISRLETMVLMSGMDLPIRAIREQVASALNLIVHQARLRDGSRKIVQITEVQGMEAEVVTLQDVFAFDFSKGVDVEGHYLGRLEPVGIRPKFYERLRDAGINLPSSMFEKRQAA